MKSARERRQYIWRARGREWLVSFGFKECFNQFDWRTQLRQEGKLDLQACRVMVWRGDELGREGVWVYCGSWVSTEPTSLGTNYTLKLETDLWRLRYRGEVEEEEEEEEGEKSTSKLRGGCHNHRDASNHPHIHIGGIPEFRQIFHLEWE